MATFQIHLDGQVQGVGIRPLAYALAVKMKLKGTVSNGPDGVNIVINGEKRECLKYYSALIDSPPSNARITNYYMMGIGEKSFNNFSILASTNSTKPTLLITPDISLCAECRIDIQDSLNRRHQYPFTTCLNCGPRYSIITHQPYDREGTTMHQFDMCSTCRSEYDDPLNRRHYSQTNSCKDCAIELSIVDSKGKVLSTQPKAVFEKMVEALASGNALAVKGIGGFHIIADATNKKAISRLRKNKNRPAKPFALLYHSVEQVRMDAQVNILEEQALTSKQNPIVLLRLKKNVSSGIQHKQIAPNLDKIGVMLPYTPLLEILMSKWNKPLIVTSGNISNSPIVYTNENALKDLAVIVDFFVLNNRDITVPQDDSVIQFALERDQPIFLRRSRGYAPTYLPMPFGGNKASTLAMGADLKSAFAMLDSNNLFVSQYLGDLESFDTQEAFQRTLDNLLMLCKAVPERILVDEHPEYFSSILGQDLTNKFGAEIHSVQHHKAHFSAVLAENLLLESQGPVLGVIWDGTGWGEDGAIWGGEFFSYKNFEFERIAHLDYFDHFLGDKISREPRLSAMSLCKDISQAEEIIRNKFSKEEWRLYSSLLNQGELLQTSSMGRLFDGVASLLGLCDSASYEGEAAMYLEALALKLDRWVNPWAFAKRFSLEQLMNKVIDELRQGTPNEEIAYQFHQTLVLWIEQVAVQQNCNRIAFSGGVFQNSLLINLITKNLNAHFELFFHKQLPPNDECIGFGQLAFDHLQNKRKRNISYEYAKI